MRKGVKTQKHFIMKILICVFEGLILLHCQSLASPNEYIMMNMPIGVRIFLNVFFKSIKDEQKYRVKEILNLISQLFTVFNSDGEKLFSWLVVT